MSMQPSHLNQPWQSNRQPHTRKKSKIEIKVIKMLHVSDYINRKNRNKLWGKQRKKKKKVSKTILQNNTKLWTTKNVLPLLDRIKVLLKMTEWWERVNKYIIIKDITFIIFHSNSIIEMPKSNGKFFLCHSCRIWKAVTKSWTEINRKLVTNSWTIFSAC